MLTNRHTILQLVHSGRISAAEAERLLIVCNEGSETAWMLAAVAAVAVAAHIDMQGLSWGILHIAQSLLRVVHPSAQQAIEILNRLPGGGL